MGSPLTWLVVRGGLLLVRLLEHFNTHTQHDSLVTIVEINVLVQKLLRTS